MPRAGHAPGETEIDQELERAAAKALGEREGTIIVLDPQTGRVRAIANPRLAFEQAFPPGSTIKPFTALVALRAGLINADSATLCRGHYTSGPFTIACSHPKSDAPFNLVQALAHSCNYSFATLSERINESAWKATLTSFGFGEPTGINSPGESAGKLERGGEWNARLSLGEGEQLLVTPIQLLTAYTALVNGGRLLRPQIGGAAGANTGREKKAQLNIAPAYRTLLLKGMRDAMLYGTASHADLAAVPLHLFGKTGTSTDSNNFRTQGWFVGFAAGGENVSSENIKLGVLVFLRRAHGADAAAASRPVFEAFARIVNQTAPPPPAGETRTESELLPPVPDAAAARSLPATTEDQTVVRVRAVSREVTTQLPLEEYVREVVATEASTEEEFEALKAQSIATRTYARKNLGRHAAEGYDFCSTTHCQRFVLPAAGKDRRADVERAVGETAGLILRDERNELIESFFHASCGGMTANIKTLWGGSAPAPAYLAGVRDDYCLTMPHARWVDRIAAADLVKALASDPRADVGRRLDEVRVTRRDRTGRAEALLLEGERTRTLSGWDLKMIVGRTLGWNHLKSSRYEVTRSGETFIFRGGGFGHGLGLCQEGAHVMARRGADAPSILAHYFPATRIATFAPAPEAKNKARVMRDPLWPPAEGMPPLAANAPAGRQTIQSSEHFRLVSSEAGGEKLGAQALEILEAARRALVRRAGGNAEEGWPRVEVIIYGSTSQFVDATGQPGWVGGVARGNRLQLQPLALLARRGILETTLRHEYAHTVIENLSRGRAPRWLAEGLAAHVAGEGRMLASRRAREIGRDDLDRALERPATREEMIELYATAYREVRALIRSEGESAVWRNLSR